MSQSDASRADASRAARFLVLVEGVADVEHETRQIDWPDPMDMDACGHLLGMAIRFYVAAADQKPDAVPLPQLGLTPTDAVVVAAAALRDQDLSPFDLTLWFQRVMQEAKTSNSYIATADAANIDRLRPVPRSSQL